MTEVVQLVAKGLGITWKLHTAYHPQSSEKVEPMNRTLNLPGDPPTVGSVTDHGCAQD
jgi:hypothetical protein